MAPVPGAELYPAVSLLSQQIPVRVHVLVEVMAHQGEVEVAVLLSVSLVREMSIQLPLSNLTWPYPCRDDCTRSIQLLSIRPTLWVAFSPGEKFTPGVDGSFHEAGTR
jgi:hypothetical protein